MKVIVFYKSLDYSRLSLAATPKSLHLQPVNAASARPYIFGSVPTSVPLYLL